MLRIFKRDLLLCAATTFLVIVCALAWGSPFVGSSVHADTVSGHERGQSTVFQGFIVREGERFLLRDTSGQIFHLEGGNLADDLVGKAVTVTGRLEAASHVIHIDGIHRTA